MAGSFRHIIHHDGSFRGVELIDDGRGRDAYEALEECYDMLMYLTGGDRQKLFEAWRDGHLAKACPSNVPSQTLERWWPKED